MDPSPPSSQHPAPSPAEKPLLRARFRKARKDHFEALSESIRALILNRPPAPILQHLPPGAVIGLYDAVGPEAPAAGWARWLAEHGRPIALPWFESKSAAMQFRIWNDPWSQRGLVPSPWGGRQPDPAGELVTPDVLIVPLLAFTRQGDRLGQGGGHYDRWLGDHPDVPAIGLAWDCQLTDALPVEPHDRRLIAVVTPTQIHEGVR